MSSCKILDKRFYILTGNPCSIRDATKGCNYRMHSMEEALELVKTFEEIYDLKIRGAAISRVLSNKLDEALEVVEKQKKEIERLNNLLEATSNETIAKKEI